MRLISAVIGAGDRVAKQLFLVDTRSSDIPAGFLVLNFAAAIFCTVTVNRRKQFTA